MNVGDHYCNIESGRNVYRSLLVIFTRPRLWETQFGRKNSKKMHWFSLSVQRFGLFLTKRSLHRPFMVVNWNSKTHLWNTFRPRLALKLAKGSKKGKKLVWKIFYMGFRKRKISCWFQIRWKCFIKIHTKKVIRKTNWRTWVKWKSAYFRHVFVNNFFRMELLLEFRENHVLKCTEKTKNFPKIFCPLFAGVSNLLSFDHSLA
jgi:hypothetical protein